MIQQSHFGYIPKRIASKVSKRYSYIHVHSSIVHKSQKVEAIQVSVYGWMDKQMRSVHTADYYSASKRKEVLTHALTWMNLEDIMLCEISELQEDAV